METLHTVKLTTATITLFTALVSMSLLAQAHTPNQPDSTSQSGKSANLEPIVVKGHHLPLPVMLQVVRTALNRSWSNAAKDKNKLVCRFESEIGTHFETLRCMTNKVHSKFVNGTQQSLMMASQGQGIGGLESNGNTIPSQVGNWVNSRNINPAAIHAMLHKLPPASSSYKLVVKDHGKPVIEYVVKHGKLVKIYKFENKETGKMTH